MENAPDELDEAPAAPRRGLSPLVAGVLAALLGIAIGFAAGVALARPDHPGDDSPEAGFARDMSLHHSQAVEMGMIAYDRSSRTGVSQMAYDIVTSQEAQIGIMTAWLDEWDLPKGSSRPAMSWMPHGEHQLLPDGRMRGMASPEEIDQLRRAEGDQLDILFAKLMLAHHRGGVHMAEAVLDQSDNPDVRELAQSMVTAQKSEIQMLTELLTTLGASP